MTVYLDTSAMLKLVLDEPDSKSLREFARGVKDGGESPSTSWLGETEFRRACMRYGVMQEAAESTLSEFDILDMPQDIYLTAGRIPTRELRTLDSLHIAVAQRARTDFFISYDQRQCEAAASAGLRVLTP